MSKKKFTYSDFKNLVMPIIKNALMKRALLFMAKALGTTLTGFKGWVAKLIVEKLYEHVAVPITLLLIRKGFLMYDKVDGHFKLRRIKKAKEGENAELYWETISNI